MAVCLALAALTWATVAHAESPASCPAVPGAEDLWARQATYVVVGEYHGTAEIPALFGDLVCAAASKDRRIVVALERPTESRQAIQRFLSSAGAAADRRELAGALRIARSDGRASKAMIGLLARVRALRAAGRRIDVLPFQPSEPISTPAEYERRMASVLTSAAAAPDRPLVLALVGNVHAMKSLPAGGPVSHATMAMHLPRSETVSINTKHYAGRFWGCRSAAGGAAQDCGDHSLPSKDLVTPRGITMADEASGAYDGRYSVGVPFTASPPAAADP